VSDIKLFRFESANMHELSGQAVQVEKSLQGLFESNLEALLAYASWQASIQPDQSMEDESIRSASSLIARL
jgi:hypothetical protein